jgi:hypothetical protein
LNRDSNYSKKQEILSMPHKCGLLKVFPCTRVLFREVPLDLLPFIASNRHLLITLFDAVVYFIMSPSEMEANRVTSEIQSSMHHT